MSHRDELSVKGRELVLPTWCVHSLKYLPLCPICSPGHLMQAAHRAGAGDAIPHHCAARMRFGWQQSQGYGGLQALCDVQWTSLSSALTHCMRKRFKSQHPPGQPALRSMLSLLPPVWPGHLPHRTTSSLGAPSTPKLSSSTAVAQRPWVLRHSLADMGPTSSGA